MSGLPEAVLRRIVAEENPQRVILFGSRARGEARADSDYDLMVVLDDDVPETQLRRSYVEGVDVLRCRPSWLRDRAHIRGAFAATILREGQTIYAREGADALMPTNSPEHTPVTEAATWLKRIDQDLTMVRFGMSHAPPLDGPAAFHLQQAAEKLVKALLILADQEVPKTHNLADLLERLGPSPAIDAAWAPILTGMTLWAFAGRYPDGPPEPDAATLAATLPIVEALRDRVAARLQAG